MHRNYKGEIIYRKISFDETEKDLEQKANWFAISLLMLIESVILFWNFFQSTDKLSEVFGVSNAVANWRVENLNKLGEL